MCETKKFVCDDQNGAIQARIEAKGERIMMLCYEEPWLTAKQAKEFGEQLIELAEEVEQHD